MSAAPTVIVRKGGFMSSLVSGVFGTLIVSIVCGTGLGLYGLNLVDRKFGQVVESGQALLKGLPNWSDGLPIVADALHDRRAPEYREQLEVSVRLTPARGDDGCRRAIVEVSNRGSDVVTFLSGRLVISDRDGVPLAEYRRFIATPLSVDEGDWRGPLLPGSTRRFAQPICEDEPDLQAALELTDVRTWHEHPAPAASPTEPATPPTP